MSTDSTKRIVIAGASGLLGVPLTKRLAEHGHSVTALVRDVGLCRASLSAADKIFQWNADMTEGDWASAIDGADAVVNLAGFPIAGKPFSGKWTSERRALIRDSRLNSTRNIIGAISRATTKPSVFLNSSAVGYYGTSLTGKFDEQSGPGSDFLGQLCNEWEKEASAAEGLGVRTILLRTGIVLSTEGGALPELLRTFRMFLGGPLGTGQQWFPWIHIDDEIGFIVHAIENDSVRGPVNLVAPEHLTNREFSTILGKVIHRPSILPVPEIALAIMFGESRMLLTEGQLVSGDKMRRSGYRFRFHTAEAALRNLLNRSF